MAPMEKLRFQGAFFSNWSSYCSDCLSRGVCAEDPGLPSVTPLQVWRSLTHVEFRGYSSMHSRSKNEKAGPVGEVGTKPTLEAMVLIAAGRDTF